MCIYIYICYTHIYYNSRCLILVFQLISTINCARAIARHSFLCANNKAKNTGALIQLQHLGAIEALSCQLPAHARLLSNVWPYSWMEAPRNAEHKYFQ